MRFLVNISAIRSNNFQFTITSFRNLINCSEVHNEDKRCAENLSSVHLVLTKEKDSKIIFLVKDIHHHQMSLQNKICLMVSQAELDCTSFYEQIL